MKKTTELFPQIQIESDVKRLVKISNVNFDEDFIAQLVSNYFRTSRIRNCPTISHALEIYLKENPSSKRKKFRNNVNYYYKTFTDYFGNLPLHELRHWHITKYRDLLLAKGLHPNSIRKHNNILNAMINMAFKHLDIDRLSPFRGLRILGEGEPSKIIPVITSEKMIKIKEFLMHYPTPSKLVGLIQLNTGCRVSEPSMARLADLVLDHEIPHLWVRKNKHTDRKTKASIRSIPLCGVSLDAAKELYKRARRKNSEWLVPQYGKEVGGTNCSAAMNKSLKPFQFTTHMFRHAFIDRVKAQSDIPIHIAECITGHARNLTEFSAYGSVGYTLEQKKNIIEKVLV